MIEPSPKWLEIFQLSGWKTAAGTLVGTGYFVLPIKSMAPVLSHELVAGFFVIWLLVFGSFTIVYFIQWIVETFDAVDRLQGHFRKRSEVKELNYYFPLMTEKDRQIIGYLLHNNQQIFSYSQDGGFASELIARGVVVSAIRNLQAVGEFQFPFEFPNHLWKVLSEKKGEFPYVQGSDDVPPWVIPWMAR